MTAKTEGNMQKEKRHLTELEKRKRCLEVRIERETTSETPAQKKELAALVWVIGKVKSESGE